MSIAEQDILNALMRNSLSAFIQKSFDIVTGGENYLHNWHIDLIAQHLEACERGDIKRLIITVPPRYMKSICASVAFPAWLLGRNANAKIIQASYSKDLSNNHSRDCKAIMESEMYRKAFPSTVLKYNPNTQSEYKTTKEGLRLSTSVGGTLTGRGADFIIIDDPLKPDEALSNASRQKVNDWMDNTLITRLNNKKEGCIIIIMQRLHEDDLVGHVMEQEEWVHLNLPALCEQQEALDIHPNYVDPYTIVRKEGDALHSERESAAQLITLRDKQMGSYLFAAQYQQSPAPYGGGMIKLNWFKRYSALPDMHPMRIMQSWDTATKAGELHDYSVCTTWHEYDDGWYLVDVLRKRLEFPDLMRAIPYHAEQHSPNVILIEDKGSGTQLIQDLQRSTKFNIKPIVPQGDKVTRMSVQTPCIETGKISIPQNANWLAEFENEISKFPNARHDDQVDSMSQALQWIHDQQFNRVGFCKAQMDDIQRMAKNRRFRRDEKLW